jgi:hypothetical protein
MSYIVRGRKKAALAPPGPKEREARRKWRETWISRNPELAELVAILSSQLELGEITEADYWWLLGEDQSDKST